jgi:hypothetical protein
MDLEALVDDVMENLLLADSGDAAVEAPHELIEQLRDALETARGVKNVDEDLLDRAEEALEELTAHKDLVDVTTLVSQTQTASNEEMEEVIAKLGAALQARANLHTRKATICGLTRMKTKDFQKTPSRKTSARKTLLSSLQEQGGQLSLQSTKRESKKQIEISNLGPAHEGPTAKTKDHVLLRSGTTVLDDLVVRTPQQSRISLSRGLFDSPDDTEIDSDNDDDQGEEAEEDHDFAEMSEATQGGKKQMSARLSVWAQRYSVKNIIHAADLQSVQEAENCVRMLRAKQELTLAEDSGDAVRFADAVKEARAAGVQEALIKSAEARLFSLLEDLRPGARFNLKNRLDEAQAVLDDSSLQALVEALEYAYMCGVHLGSQRDVNLCDDVMRLCAKEQTKTDQEVEQKAKTRSRAWEAVNSKIRRLHGVFSALPKVVTAANKDNVNDEAAMIAHQQTRMSVMRARHEKWALSIVNHEAADIPKKLGRSNTISGGDDAKTGEDMESPRMKARQTKFDQNVTVN